MELAIDGRDMVTDPGTYLYTPIPSRRNQYRSVGAHFSPFAFLGLEPSSFEYGLFRLGPLPKTECLYAGEMGFLGKYRTVAGELWRGIRLEGNRILLKDSFSGQGDRAEILRKASAWSGVPVATGYGELAQYRTMDGYYLEKFREGIHEIAHG